MQQFVYMVKREQSGSKHSKAFLTSLLSAKCSAGPSRDVGSCKAVFFPTLPQESAEGEKRCFSFLAHCHMEGFSAVT